MANHARAMPEPIPVYKALRDAIIGLSPQKVGLTPSAEAPHCWGVLLEIGSERAVATLVALADGTTSLYFSSGGGVIGCGGHAAVAAAARKLVAAADAHLSELRPTSTFPLPGVGRLRFYLLTFSGALTAEVAEEELQDGQHPLAALYTAGQEVLTQVRLLTP